MSDMVKGTLQGILKKPYNGKTMYSIKVNDTAYGCGALEPKFAEGDVLEFPIAQNAKGYWTVKVNEIKKIGRISEAEMQSDKAEKTAFEKRKQESIEYQAAGRRAVETIVGRPEVFKFNTIDEYFYWVRQVANYHYALIQSKGEAGIDVLPPVSVPTSNSSNSKLPSTKRIPAVKPTSKTAEQIDPNEGDEEADESPY